MSIDNLSDEELDELFTQDTWCNPQAHEFDPQGKHWQALNARQRLAYAEAAEKWSIRHTGYAVRAKGPVDSGFGPKHHYAYTVGCTPTVIVTGLSTTARTILEPIVPLRSKFKAGVVFAPFDESEGRAVFAPVPKTIAKSLTNCEWTVNQFIWCDDELQWPWEPGHARQIRIAHGGEDTMPILAGRDWRPANHVRPRTST